MRSVRLSKAVATPLVVIGLLAATGAVAPVRADNGSNPLAPVLNLVNSVTAPVTQAVNPVVATVNKTVAPATAPVTSHGASAIVPAAAPVAAPQTSHTSNAVAPRASVTSNAPASNASATGLLINALDTCISCTSANAQSGSSAANGTGIRLLGHDLSSGKSLSTSSDSGALIALPVNPLLGLAIADWMTSATASPSSTSAHSRASLVDLDLGSGQLATVAVLESISNAAWTPGHSSSNAETNGVNANLLHGALVVVLLHSQSSSDGKSSVYLVGVNGTTIGTADNGQGSIGIPLAPIANIVLLLTGANGGNGTQSSITKVADLLSPILGTGPTGTLLGTTSAGGGNSAPPSGCATPPCGPPTACTTPPCNGNGTPNGTPNGNGNPNRGALPLSGGLGGLANAGAPPSIPNTGVGIQLAGIALVLLGMALAVVAPRWRRARQH